MSRCYFLKPNISNTYCCVAVHLCWKHTSIHRLITEGMTVVPIDTLMFLGNRNMMKINVCGAMRNMESILYLNTYHASKYEFSQFLTHLPIVPHICIRQLGEHWFRWWLVAYLAPNHYIKQCWVIVNWTLRNSLQWNFNQNSKFFIRKMCLEMSSASKILQPFGPGEMKK